MALLTSWENASTRPFNAMVLLMVPRLISDSGLSFMVVSFNRSEFDGEPRGATALPHRAMYVLDFKMGVVLAVNKTGASQLNLPAGFHGPKRVPFPACDSISVTADIGVEGF